MASHLDGDAPTLAHYRELSGDSLPTGLRDMSHPPTQAGLWGRLPPGPYVSIVGTRSPSPAGRASAFLLARQLAQRGVTIVSGGAVGIDSAAHHGALAVRGKTVVVGPTRHPEAYPKENRPLFERILAEGGGYLSLAHEGQAPLNTAFFRRNEALVALSDVVVLGECPRKSGARNAFFHARRLGKKRFVLAFSFDEARAEGSWDEWNRGGAGLLFRAESVLEYLVQTGSFENPVWMKFLKDRQDQDSAPTAARAAPVSQRGRRRGRGPVQRAPAGRSLPAVAQEVLRAVGEGAGTVDEIEDALGLGVAVIQHNVVILTLHGLLFEDEGGLLRYQGTADP